MFKIEPRINSFYSTKTDKRTDGRTDRPKKLKTLNMLHDDSKEVEKK